MSAVSPFVVVGVFLVVLFPLVQGTTTEAYFVTVNRNAENKGLYPVQTATLEHAEMLNFTTNAECNDPLWGISTVDSKRGILYFSDGSESGPARILATDLKNKVALTPTVVSAVEAISDFAYDNVNDRLFLFTYNNEAQTLASFQDGKLQPFWEAPLDLRIHSVGLDQENQRLLMITTNKKNAPLEFTVLDLASKQTKSFKLSDECETSFFLSRLVWSPKQGKAYGFIYRPHRTNTTRKDDIYVTVIDPEEQSCESVLIQVPEGFVMDCAIDALSDRIYFTQKLYNNFGYLYVVYDIADQVVLSAWVISPAKVEPISIALGPSFK